MAAFSQTTLVNYQFNNNLTADAGALGTPNLSYHASNGNVKAPDYNDNMLSTEDEGDYLELAIDATGRQNLVLSFYGDFRALAILGYWRISVNTGAGGSYVDIGAASYWSVFNIVIGDDYSLNLPVAAEGKPDLKIRIRSDFASIGGRLRLDNLKLTSGNPNIFVYSNANTYIPHLSAASVALTTDFGTRQTSDAALTRTFRIRNLNGTSGSQLQITNITVSGANAADFTANPTSISSIGVSTSATGNPFGNFNISFLPQGDGLRTAEISIYSNSSPNPYKFTVIGTGASCNLVSSTYAQNTMSVGTHTLPGNYSASDLIGGSANPAASNTISTRLYPNGSLSVSSPTSWYVRNTTKTVEFGNLNISNQKNVSISFKVSAFTTSNYTNFFGNALTTDSRNGLNNLSYIILSVQKPDNTWSNEMRLQGSANSNTFFRYDFSGSGTFSSSYSGNNPNVIQSNSSGTKYSTVTLDIPASSLISNLKFRITAITDTNERLWLIDDVTVNTSNAVYKTFTTANVWSPSAPTQNEKAVIEGNYVNSGNSTVCECEVKEGGSLTIPGNTSVTVKGKITNLGNGDNFIVASDGNLIQIENNAVNAGSIKAQRYVSNVRNNLATYMDYIYWSSPVANQQTKGSGGFSPGTPPGRFYQYNEPNDYFYQTPDLTFIAGKGYAVRAEGTVSGTGTSPDFPYGYNKTYEFKGNPHNGVINYDIQRSANSGTTEHGYNMIGNPYPSNINFDSFYAANSSVIYNTVWFWGNDITNYYQSGSGYSGNAYSVYNGTGGLDHATSTGSNLSAPNGIIKVGQGVIVQKKNPPAANPANAATLTFNNTMRVATAGQFYSKLADQKNRFWLKLVSPANIANTLLIGYIPGATSGYEKDFDAESMGMSSDLFYSVLEDKKLLIQGKGEFDAEDKILLGANFFESGQYNISLMLAEGIFENGQNIYLKDNVLNTYTSLNEGSYTFEVTKGINEGRFEIVYKSPFVLAVSDAVNDDLTVYRNGDNFEIKSSSKSITIIEVYDVSGRLYKKLMPNEKHAVIETSGWNSGMYILKINRNGLINSKKILK